MTQTGRKTPDTESGSLATTILHNSAPTQSLAEQIAENVAQAIIAGDYPPGRRIQEQVLAAKFQVSRGPIREALRILEKEGLVQILPRRGAQVTKLTVEEINDIFEIRASLLGLAAKLATKRNDPEINKKFDQEARRVAASVRNRESADEYVMHTHRMNLFLAESSNNKQLHAMIYSLAKQTLRYSRLGLSTEKRRQQSAKNWRALVDAVREMRPAEAEEAAKQLVYDSRDTAVHLLRSGREPDFG